MAVLKKLTLLHSNDMHGDFLAENIDKKLIGGVSMLSGYINKVRSEDASALYVIAGDMFRGSVIDSEFKGASTIDIMNYLGPDVVSLGNHEVDYGIAHLLFMERCAKFPIINANLYIKTSGTRLFRSHKVIKINGMNILFIGVITEEIMERSKRDDLLGTLVDVNEAAAEVAKICNCYKGLDTDLTVLLTHIGFERDKELAALLDPRLGVDIIIGGHSHTILEHPEIVNGILIAQAGEGTNQIGRFDIVVNTDENRVESCEWQLVPIDAEHCPRDLTIEEVIDHYKRITDNKYNRIVTRLARRLTHPRRNMGTEMGCLFADILREQLGVDIMMLASGSIRTQAIGPIVKYQDIVEAMPFDDPLLIFKATGAQIRRMFAYMLRDKMLTNETEFYQVPSSVKVTYCYPQKRLLELTINGREAEDSQMYTVGMAQYHLDNIEQFLGLPYAEIEKNGRVRMFSTSARDLLEEYLSQHANEQRKAEGRIEILGLPETPASGAAHVAKE